MGRTHNQDYYKVGGGTAGSGVMSEGRQNQDRSQFSNQRAQLKRDASRHSPPVKPEPPHKHAPAQRGEVRAPRENQPSARRQAERAGERKEARPHKQPAPQPVAIVQEMHDLKPRHGKKRRSAKKRHEVAVLQEMHPEAYHAGVEERPPAPVADLRDRRAQIRRPEDRGPDTLPPAAQGYVQKTMEFGKQAFHIAWELATAPITVAKLLARLREREA